MVLGFLCPGHPVTGWGNLLIGCSLKTLPTLLLGHMPLLKLVAGGEILPALVPRPSILFRLDLGGLILVTLALISIRLLRLVFGLLLLV